MEKRLTAELKSLKEEFDFIHKKPANKKSRLN